MKGLITEIIPITKVESITTVPSKSPIAKLLWLFLTALIEKNNSGKQVPKETNTKPTKTGGIFMS